MPNYEPKYYQGRDSHGQFSGGIKGGPTHAQYANMSFGGIPSGWAVHGSSVARVHGSPRVPKDLDIVAKEDVWEEIKQHPSTRVARWNPNVLYSSEFRGEIGKTREGGGLSSISDRDIERAEQVRDRWKPNRRLEAPYIQLGQYQKAKANVVSKGRTTGGTRKLQQDTEDLEWANRRMKVEQRRKLLKHVGVAVGSTVILAVAGNVVGPPRGNVDLAFRNATHTRLTPDWRITSGGAWTPMSRTPRINR